MFGKTLWKSHKYVSTGEIAGNHKKAGRPNTLTSRVTYHQQKKSFELIFFYHQDNETKHTSYFVHEWVVYHCKQRKSPPQSPGLNPYERVCSKEKKEASSSNFM